MDQVAIVGAGELGGLVAHRLAQRHVANDILLLDDNRRAAEGKALDITEAAPIERLSSRLAGGDDLPRAAGSSTIVLADPFGAERSTDASLALIARLRDFSKHAVIICAGSADREVVERGVRELGVPRTRLIGSAPEALAGGARAMVAVESDRSANDVSLTVLGIPPHEFFVPWEDATVGGFSLTRMLDEPSRRRIHRRVAVLWPPGPAALAAAAAHLTAIVLGKSRRLASCFVGPDDSSGIRARAAALPVRIGETGTLEVVLPQLTARERVLLDNAVLL